MTFTVLLASVRPTPPAIYPNRRKHGTFTFIWQIYSPITDSASTTCGT
ncbi:MAG: hypothetical protein EDM05_56335 [Leptolyngbya sp. IPPAS B-1204]|uniref:Uncharacterized protein n=1 Tax=Leptolyngbya sp. NK1-12 TaxID=2547451 RepID=A0AA96WH08_9CYAN|nr:hypothetical protein [Leptolyngbya sp. NK1-12]WNZ25912.1 hypothetical protein HJG54_25840 [Leptolyngbya sp. NK1-12]